MSGEVGLGALDTKNLMRMNIQIEEDLNNYLKSISYSNEKLTRVRLILIIRNDDFSALGSITSYYSPICRFYLKVDICHIYLCIFLKLCFVCYTWILGGEYIRKQPKEPIMNCHLRIDYNEFKNGNEQTRKLLIYQAILQGQKTIIFLLNYTLTLIISPLC
jgi:hypothetical protein